MKSIPQQPGYIHIQAPLPWLHIVGFVKEMKSIPRQPGYILIQAPLPRLLLVGFVEGMKSTLLALQRR